MFSLEPSVCGDRMSVVEHALTPETLAASVAPGRRRLQVEHVPDVTQPPSHDDLPAREALPVARHRVPITPQTRIGRDVYSHRLAWVRCQRGPSDQAHGMVRLRGLQIQLHYFTAASATSVGHLHPGARRAVAPGKFGCWVVPRAVTKAMPEPE